MSEVFVAHNLVDKCYAFGEKVVDSYQRGKKEASRNLALKGKPPIDADVEVQAAGRMAECAACIYLELDPIKELDWSSKCDGGYDFKMHNGIKVDVKASTHPHARKLIWPVTKVDFLEKAADVLLFAKVRLDKAQMLGVPVELVGWVFKDEFIQHHQIAESWERGMIAGTPYMLDKDLNDVERLTSAG